MNTSILRLIGVLAIAIIGATDGIVDAVVDRHYKRHFSFIGSLPQKRLITDLRNH
jgi:hypothetical protein